MIRPIIEPFGDSGVLVTLGDRIDVELSGQAAALAEVIHEANRDRPGWRRPVPAYASVLVPVDPVDPGVEAAIERIRPVVDAIARDQARRPEPDPSIVIELPTVYGGPHGPDLATVAELHGLRPTDVVELHAGTLYTVHFLGFAPGFAYLGEVPETIATPRLATPRTRVPAGSVGIADRQSAVYPFTSPGGWRLIGRTAMSLWVVTRDPPALLRPGDRVRFIPVR